MCAGVSVGRGQSPSEETASFLGTPDSFPSEPLGYCADSLINTGNVVWVKNSGGTAENFLKILCVGFFQ